MKHRNLCVQCKDFGLYSAKTGEPLFWCARHVTESLRNSGHVGSGYMVYPSKTQTKEE